MVHGFSSSEAMLALYKDFLIGNGNFSINPAANCLEEAAIMSAILLVNIKQGEIKHSEHVYFF